MIDPIKDVTLDGFFYDAPSASDHLGYTIFFHAENFLVTADAATDGISRVFQNHPPSVC
jgi:hypothetical protein